MPRKYPFVREDLAMRCWNCDRDIPKTAKICGYCESPVEEEPTEEEMAAARDLLESLPPDAVADLHRVIRDTATAEEFLDRIFVGDCPKCGGTHTADCEDDLEIGEMLVGRCYDCGQLWCTECLRLLEPTAASCPCWKEDPSQDEDFGEEFS